MHMRSLVAVLLIGAPTAAQASWTMLYPTAVPPPRVEATLGAHERLGKTILLWGAEGGVQATTAWVLTGNSWSLQPGAVPSPRLDAALAFDAARDQLVVFGGNNPGFALLDDTWRWNGTTWTLAPTPTRPPARLGAAMAFDRTRSVVVLFGGQSSGGGPFPYFADTWEWNGVVWQQRLPSTSPPARLLPSMAFDPVSGGVLLFGGIGSGPGSGTIYTDSWTWNGTNWTQHQPATPPPARIWQGMVTDLDRQRIVLFGGQGGDAFTWQWDGSQWHADNLPSPGSRFRFGMVYDAAARRVVVHGGQWTTGSSYFLFDTWIYRTPLPADVAPFGSGCAGTAGTPVLANAPYTLPWLGDTMRNVVQTIPAGELGAFFVSSFGSTPPLPLGSLGMPGCDLFVPLDVVEFRAAAAGLAEWALAIPNTPSLAAAQFRQQAFVLDATANALGLVASNGVTVTLGVR